MKRILSFTIAAACIFLLLAMCGSVYASDTPTIKLSGASAAQGDEVEITVSIENNTKGFFMLEMNISFDKEALEFIGCETKLPDGINSLPDKQANDKGKLPIIYLNKIGEGANMSLQNVEGDRELFVLTFKVKEQTSAGIYDLALEVTNAMYIGDKETPALEVNTENGAISVAATVSGRIFGFLDASAPITVSLYSDEILYTSATVYSNTAAYSFNAIKPGEYTLIISKDNHISRKITVVVGEEDVVMSDVTLDLYGDVNKDRVIDGEDLEILSRYLAKWANYSLDLTAADVNVDGVVNNLDRAILARYLDSAWADYNSLPYNP